MFRMSGGPQSLGIKPSCGGAGWVILSRLGAAIRKSIAYCDPVARKKRQIRQDSRPVLYPRPQSGGNL
jgi:hypothetical protein